MIPLESFPHLNASLNALSGVLITVGYIAIRTRRVTFHKICMASAGVVALAFLTCYLYYHFHHGVTRFPRGGIIRITYLTILFSHTVLAAANLPLVVVTFYRALKGQLEKHKRIARWALPIWLYVSVSGVVVYVMLYHLYPSE